MKTTNSGGLKSPLVLINKIKKGEIYEYHDQYFQAVSKLGGDVWTVMLMRRDEKGNFIHRKPRLMLKKTEMQLSMMIRHQKMKLPQRLDLTYPKREPMRGEIYEPIAKCFSANYFMVLSNEGGAMVAGISVEKTEEDGWRIVPLSKRRKMSLHRLYWRYRITKHRPLFLGR